MAKCEQCDNQAAAMLTLCDSCIEERNKARASRPTIVQQRAAEAAEAEENAPTRVTIVDVDIPIMSLILLQLKLIVAGIPFALAIVALYAVARAWSTP